MLPPCGPSTIWCVSKPGAHTFGSADGLSGLQIEIETIGGGSTFAALPVARTSCARRARPNAITNTRTAAKATPVDFLVAIVNSNLASRVLAESQTHLGLHGGGGGVLNCRASRMVWARAIR